MGKRNAIDFCQYPLQRILGRAPAQYTSEGLPNIRQEMLQEYVSLPNVYTQGHDAECYFALRTMRKP